MPRLCGVLLASTAPLHAQETPLERNDFGRLTSHQEVVAFVRELAASSDRLTARTLGRSVEGRPIPYVEVSLGRFGTDRENRVVALLFAQQHGDEPSGKEGMLSFARDLAQGRYDDLLRRVDLLLVPQVNPDGAERHGRRNGEGVDLNRSHLALDGHEVRALRDLFHRWEPEVTVDLHEYSPWSGAWLERGWLRLFDQQIGLPTNPNTHPAIRELAKKGFLSFAESFLSDHGFTSHNYLVGTPDRIRFSTTHVNDGRQGFGILNTLSFIYEGRRGRTPTDGIRRRARGQHLAMEALLRFLADHPDEVLSAVRGARREVAEGRVDELVLTMSRQPGDGPLRIPVESVRLEGSTWRVTDTIVVEIEAFHPRIVPEERTSLPEAYVIPAEMSELRELLEGGHRVELRDLAEGEWLEAERLVVVEMAQQTLESSISLPVVRAVPERYRARRGDVVVPTAQLRGLLVATALEPRSMHSLYLHDRFRHLMRIGPFPILRVPGSP